MIEFMPMPKIPRLTRECVITEKIDGTNASIYIGECGEFLIGSRNRWITVENDNYGFARWATENKEDLLKLGVGHHFGEWWGIGIQRGYGLKNGDKRFSLFNVGKWNEDNKPMCCNIVPIIYQGIFLEDAVYCCLQTLIDHGSKAVEGFMNPEGIIIYHAASKCLFKKTIKNDEKGKGE